MPPFDAPPFDAPPFDAPPLDMPAVGMPPPGAPESTLPAELPALPPVPAPWCSGELEHPQAASSEHRLKDATALEIIGSESRGYGSAARALRIF
jgi:hypothetical protein